LAGGPFQNLGAPDVVDQDVDDAILGAEPVGQSAHLLAIQMVDLDRHAGAAEVLHQLCSLLDGFGPVVVRSHAAGGAAAAGADDGGAGLAEGRRDTAPGTAGRAGDDRHLAPQRVGVRQPVHGLEYRPPAGIPRAYSKR
jgi:hypothetical protein